MVAGTCSSTPWSHGPRLGVLTPLSPPARGTAAALLCLLLGPQLRGCAPLLRRSPSHPFSRLADPCATLSAVARALDGVCRRPRPASCVMSSPSTPCILPAPPFVACCVRRSTRGLPREAEARVTRVRESASRKSLSAPVPARSASGVTVMYVVDRGSKSRNMGVSKRYLQQVNG